MEDILILILTAAVMIGGVVSSAIKKKKEKEAAAGKTGQNASGEPEPERRFVRKSLSEVLEELARQQDQAHEPEVAEAADDYYSYEMASHEENERAARRLREMTYVSAETTPRRIPSEPEPVVLPDEQRADTDSQNTLKGILGGEFDLRRAVIESEILKPKFEQY